MPETRLEWGLFVTGLAVLGVLIAMIVVEGKGNRQASLKPKATSVVTVPSQTHASTTAAAKRQRTAVVSAPSQEVASKRPPDTVSNLQLTEFSFSAARGDCWLLIRAGAPTGKTLYEGLLTKGSTIRYKTRRLWVRLGAASNLQVKVAGKRLVGLPFGTADVRIDESGKVQLAPYNG